MTTTRRVTARAVHDHLSPRIAAIEAAIGRGAQPPSKFEASMTVTFGLFIPIVSWTLAKVGGTAYMAGYTGVAMGLLLLLVAVLGVSLTHVAEAVHVITGTGMILSILTAIALDASLVAMEVLDATIADDLGVGGYTSGLAGAIVVVSAAANVFAFRHAQRVRNRLKGNLQ